jgi:hypothetical protein
VGNNGEILYTLTQAAKPSYSHNWRFNDAASCWYSDSV